MSAVSGKKLTNEIKSLALEMGFDVVGVTPFAGFEKGEQQLQEWIDEGRHGSMGYLADFKERQEVFLSQFQYPKSVIVLGLNYYSTQASSIVDDLRGKVARYAWGQDYHAVIKKKHDQFIHALQERHGKTLQAFSCVDTKPILERFAAVKAGLGFVGKNTMLLSKRFGPWLFLSEIVTNLDLDEDSVSQASCGTCVECQSTCPTGALDQDYRIDSRLCIAYLTIEHKGVIPKELRPKMKDWIFGCDECLSSCPFTSHQKESQTSELLQSEGAGTHLSFDELFTLESNRSYEKRFGNTALLRANRKQMLRNACIVLGNSGSERAIPYLQKGLRDKAALVRLHAAWALGQLPFAAARQVLQGASQSEPDAEVREEIHSALEASQGI